jgi:hypothetical protein
MKHIIHVHQQNIKKGLAAIIDRTYKGSKHQRTLDIVCPHCDNVAATVVQSETPDKCGARVWIEAEKTGKSNDHHN